MGGGSSTGSGAAVAAGVVPFALGTETDGSGRLVFFFSVGGGGLTRGACLVVSPARRNALVGFKPTVGLTSRAG